jgi:enoyl-CoA hydratase
MANYEKLEVSIDGPEDDVFTIRMNQPQNLNLIDERTHRELPLAFREAYESETRVVVLTGAGDVFSAGGDVSWMKNWIDDSDYMTSVVRESEDLIKNLVNIQKPIIAKVNGDAMGLGCTLALFCDIVVMSEDAKIGDPHVQVGLSAGDGGAVIWPLLTSFNKAKEFLMTGDHLTAREAMDIGLVNHVTPPEKLDAKVEERIETLTSLPQTAVRYSKMAANAWLEMGVQNILRQSLALESQSSHTDDHAEMVNAFIEGREPHPPSARDLD